VLVRQIEDLATRNPSVLVRYRNQKIRKVGHWKE
jgi:acetyl-CoA carboxylase carboxyl transferase subunit alpha